MFYFRWQLRYTNTGNVDDSLQIKVDFDVVYNSLDCECMAAHAYWVDIYYVIVSLEEWYLYNSNLIVVIFCM